MSKTTEKQIHTTDGKELFEKITYILREELLATFEKETDTSLIIRLVGGQAFCLSIENKGLR